MPTPARLAIASSDTSVPDSENVSPAASISFWRLRAASARRLAVVGSVVVKAEGASGYVLICPSGNGGSLHFTGKSSGRKDAHATQSLLHHRGVEGARPHLGRGRARTRGQGRCGGAEHRAAGQA